MTQACIVPHFVPRTKVFTLDWSKQTELFKVVCCYVGSQHLSKTSVLKFDFYYYLFSSFYLMEGWRSTGGWAFANRWIMRGVGGAKFCFSVGFMAWSFLYLPRPRGTSIRTSRSLPGDSSIVMGVFPQFITGNGTESKAVSEDFWIFGCSCHSR